VQVYLLSAIAMFSLASLLLGYGLPNTIMHPVPGGNLYGSSSFLDEHGRVITYYDQSYAQSTVYGILGSVVGIVMLALHRTSKKHAVENKTE
jgi:hypothetical protein